MLLLLLLLCVCPFTNSVKTVSNDTYHPHLELSYDPCNCGGHCMCRSYPNCTKIICWSRSS